MKKFDNDIQNILNNPPEFPFHEGAWAKMESRLDTAPIPAKSPVPFFKIAALVVLWLCSILGTSWWYQNELHIEKEKNQQLKQQLALQKENKKRPSSPSLPVPQTQTIFQYDTIYKTITIEKYQNLTRFSDNSAKDPTFPEPEVKAPQELSSLISANEEASELLPDDINRNFNTEIQKTQSLGLQLKEMKAFEALSPPKQLPKINISNKSYNTPSSSLPNLLPTGFHLGMNYSWLHPSIQSAASAGFTTGVQSEIVYGKNLRLVLGIEFLRLRYKLLGGTTSVTHYPEVHPENPRDMLDFMRADLQYLQIPFGVKYVFPSRQMLHPYIGLGMIARRPLHQNLDYEFFGDSGNYYLDRKFVKSPFTNNSVWASVGLNYSPIQSSWGLSLEGFYNYDFRKNKYELEQLRFWSLRMRVFYRL